VHLITLASSKGTWGGVRHALPLLLCLAIVAGALAWRAWQSRSRLLGGAFVGCWLVAIATTIREPRVWEYHNLLAGGTDGAYRSFSNEGLDLGQRYGEFKNLYDTVIRPSGQLFYSTYWFMEEQAQADRVQYARFCSTLEDTNTEGVYDGYYIVGTKSLIPAPHEHWDPAIFSGLERVARLGNIVVFRGRLVAPVIRAYSMSGHILEAIYKDPDPKWDLIAAKLTEVLNVMPWSEGTAILLGNASLKLDRREEAITAYEHALREMEAFDPAQSDVKQQIARLRAGEATASIQPIRSAFME
jgi:tetratricopeptide (TPR) repeat protein